MSGEILFLAHRIPFPPDRGDKIRSHHVLKALAKLAPVHVGTFADDESDFEPEAELALTAASHYVAHRGKPLALAALQGLASGEPFSLPAFDDPGLRRWVRRVLETRPIRTIYAFSSQMAQYVPADFGGRFVMDFVDVDSAKFEAYAARAAQPMTLLYAREARRLAAWEAKAGRRADVSLFVTEDLNRQGDLSQYYETYTLTAPQDPRLPGGGGYVARLYPAWQDFPSGDDAADARRMLAFIEERVLEMPEQYFWLHKRFKTRPPGEARFY